MGAVEAGEVNATRPPGPLPGSLSTQADEAHSSNRGARMTLIAHGGNLLVDLPLYGLPVLAVIVALAVSTARFRRSRSRTQTPSRRRQSG